MAKRSFEEFLADARRAPAPGEQPNFARDLRDLFWDGGVLGSIVGHLVVSRDAVRTQMLAEQLLDEASVNRARAQRGQDLAYTQVLSMLYEMITAEDGDEQPE